MSDQQEKRPVPVIDAVAPCAVRARRLRVCPVMIAFAIAAGLLIFLS